MIKGRESEQQSETKRGEQDRERVRPREKGREGKCAARQRTRGERTSETRKYEIGK